MKTPTHVAQTGLLANRMLLLLDLCIRSSQGLLVTMLQTEELGSPAFTNLCLHSAWTQTKCWESFLHSWIVNWPHSSWKLSWWLGTVSFWMYLQPRNKEWGPHSCWDLLDLLLPDRWHKPCRWNHTFLGSGNPAVPSNSSFSSHGKGCKTQQTPSGQLSPGKWISSGEESCPDLCKSKL